MRRGPDIRWQELEKFSNPEDFKQSALAKEIREQMTLNRKWRSAEARNEQYRLVDCYTQLTLIFMILHLYLCFMTNIKVTKMKDTAGKCTGANTRRREAGCHVRGRTGFVTPTLQWMLSFSSMTAITRMRKLGIM